MKWVVGKERAEAEKEPAEAEKEPAEAEYDRNLAILIGRLQHTPDASAADRAGWEQEIKKLQDRIKIPIRK